MREEEEEPGPWVVLGVTVPPAVATASCCCRSCPAGPSAAPPQAQKERSLHAVHEGLPPRPPVLLLADGLLLRLHG